MSDNSIGQSSPDVSQDQLNGAKGVTDNHQHTNGFVRSAFDPAGTGSENKQRTSGRDCSITNVADTTTSNLTTFKPDRNQAEKFLTLLDEMMESFTFQSFTDQKPQPRPDPLAKTLHGSLDEHFSALENLNRKGAGIFVTINATDLKGRKNKNITRTRAVWREMDRHVEVQPKIDPQIVVQSSPGKFHEYYLVDDLSFVDHQGIQQTLIDEYGSDPNAKDLSRVLRLPGFFHQKNPKNPHRVTIVHESKAPPYSPESLKIKIPPTVRLTRFKSRGDIPRDGNLKEPARVWSALNVINSDCEYSDWLKCGMAIHHGCRGSQEGFELWDQWSAKGSSYKEGECVYRWDSFGDNKDFKVTLATLFYMATQTGWASEYLIDKIGLKLAREERHRKLKKFGDRIGFALVEGDAAYIYRQQDPEMKDWKTVFSNLSSMSQRYENEFIPCIHVNDKSEVSVISQSIFKALKSSIYRKTYDRVSFRPIKGLVAVNDLLPKPINGNAYNLYLGLVYTPIKGDYSPILEHIRNIWCKHNQEYFEYVIKWLAAVFQRPDRPGETALVLKSGQGAGKNTILDIIARAYGIHGAVLSKSDDITGRFNDHLGTSVFVFLNEAIWGGNRNSEGIIKTLITDREFTIERKYVPKIKVRNCCHLVMATNNDWFAPVGLDDRRFFVLEASNERVDDIAYFDQLHAHIESGGDTAFIHFLLNEVDLKGFKPRMMPVTSSGVKLENKLRTADSATRWWFECLINGEIIGFQQQDSDRFSSVRDPLETETWETGSIFIIGAIFNESYRKWADLHKLHIETPHSMTRKLKELIGSQFDTRAREGSTNWVRGKRIPRLDECRAHFEIVTKQKIHW